MSGDEKRWDGSLDERVVEFVYGELSATDEAAFRQELEQRPDLRAQVADLTALRRSIDTIETPEPPAEVVADILAYAAGRNRVVRTEPVPEKRLTLADIFGWLIRPQVGMAMAALLVVAVGVYMGESARRPMEPGSAQEVKERMRPTRTVATGEEAAVATSEAESAPAPASEKPTAADEAVESKVAQPLDDQKKVAAERQPATPLAEEKAAEAAGAGSRAAQVQQVLETTGGEEERKEVSVAERATQEGKRKQVAGEESRWAEQVVEEPNQVVLDGAKAKQDTTPGAGSSGGKAGLDAGQRKGGDKVAVRSLVDSLDRRRDKSGLAATNDRYADQGATKDANADLSGRGLKLDDHANSGLAGSPAVDSTLEMDDSTHKQVNIPRKERRKKVAEKKLAGKKAQEEKREWVGNTYNRAVDGDNAGGGFFKAETATAKDNAEAVPAMNSKSPAREESKLEETGTVAEAVAAEDGPMKPQEEAPTRPAARTSVDEAWGVVPTSVPSDSLVKPVSVNPEAGNEYTAVLKKGEVKLDYGDDGMAPDHRGESQAASAAPQAAEPIVLAAPDAPAESSSEDLGELSADEDLAEEEAEAPMADKESSTDFAYEQAAPAVETEEAQLKPVEATKAEKKKAETKEDMKESDKASVCDKYWSELLAMEQAGQNDKALKLLQMFRSGPCAGTRSQSALDMREAQNYIASGKRNKARKVLKRLQKVPAMEQKAMDMMESIEGDGFGQ